jgi:hypothetical protein
MSLLSGGEVSQHVGTDVCTRDRSIWVPEPEMCVIQSMAQELLDRPRGVRGRQLAQFLEKL